MATIIIHDLNVNRELDKSALASVFGGSYRYNPYSGNYFYSDPISSYIGANTAAIAMWSPGTWSQAQQIGQAQANAWIGYVADNNFSLGSLNQMVRWAGSGYLW